MSLRAEVDLTSYDRLFPSQDFVPQKGFGNLIALPLQGRYRKQGNAVFLDPARMEPWPDQWAFLAAAPATASGDAKSIGDAIRVTAGPGSAGPMGYGPLDTTRPSSTADGRGRRSKAMLAIDRIGLPPPLVASLKHLASVHNPEFHQREQAAALDMEHAPGWSAATRRTLTASTFLEGCSTTQ